MVDRGCGKRQPGGAYLVTAVGERGDPIEKFVVDPPRIIDPATYSLSPQGMCLLIQGNKPPGVLDWVGENHYPNAADYVEETALFGSSRRIPRTFDFAFLQPGSKHLLVHPRAAVTPASSAAYEYLPDPASIPVPSALQRALLRQARGNCPFQDRADRHELGDYAARPGGEPNGQSETCAAWWWEWLLPKTVAFAPNEEAMERQCLRLQQVFREMPAFGYGGYALPDPDVWAPEFKPAIFLALPIHRVEVVFDPLDMTHELTLQRASKAGIPVVEVDE